MQDLDLVVRGGTVVTASDIVRCDVGVRGERIAALSDELPRARREVDAAGKLVLPGGVDSHCHIEQMTAAGLMNADDFFTGTRSAAFGGTTTVIPFAAQQRGQSLRAVVDAYHEAARKAVIDYAFHMIVTDPSETVLADELPALIREGHASIKLFMTYDRLRVTDEQMLDVLTLARREGAMVLVHAENHAMIAWAAARLVARGYTAPRYHAVAHVRAAEVEAVGRAIGLAALIDQPLLVVHVSTEAAMAIIGRARDQGLKVFAETCPQYLFFTAEDLDKPGREGAKWMFSPPPRDEADQRALWRGLRSGTFQVFSSDHAPFRFDATGKLAAGPEPAFNEIANGIPGLELRMPLLFSEGVRAGRIDLNRFVRLCCTEGARLYGLHPKKGTIAVGADADLAVWDPDREVEIGDETTHDAAGYCPYAGMTITGWPVTVVARGEVIVDGGTFLGERGRGRFLPRLAGEAAEPLGRFVPELDPARNFGARLLD